MGPHILRAFYEISDRFNRNIDRVENLVRLYGLIDRKKPEDAELEQDDDILRAALVFLHATVEDFLRSILAWKLPESSPDEIDKIPLLGQMQKTPAKFNLGSLVMFKDLSVDQLIRKSIHDHLDKWVSFNDVAQIHSVLRICGIDLGSFDYATLGSIMLRRHEIVHRADTIPSDATDSSLSPIYVDTLHTAIAATRHFFECISVEIKKSYYLPQFSIPKLFEYAGVLAENGSVSLKDWASFFDIPQTGFYKLRADLLNIGLGSLDTQKKHILSNLEKGEIAVKITQRFCKNHAVFRRIINDPRLNPKFSQKQFLEIVVEVCSESFESSRTLDLRSKRLLLLFWTAGFISQKGNELTLLLTPSSAAQVTTPENITRTRLRGLFFGDSPPLSLVNGLVQLAKKNVSRAEAHKLVGRNTVRSLLKFGLITADLRPNSKKKIDSSTARTLVREAAQQDAAIKFCVDLVLNKPEIDGKEIGRLVTEEFECSWVERSQRRNGNALAGWAHWILGSGASSASKLNLRTPKQIANALRSLTPEDFGSLPLATKKYAGKKGEPSRGRPPSISENLYGAITILRQEHGLSNTEIAKRIGVTRPTLLRAGKRYGS